MTQYTFLKSSTKSCIGLIKIQTVYLLPCHYRAACIEFFRCGLAQARWRGARKVLSPWLHSTFFQSNPPARPLPCGQRDMRQTCGWQLHRCTGAAAECWRQERVRACPVNAVGFHGATVFEKRTSHCMSVRQLAVLLVSGNSLVILHGTWVALELPLARAMMWREATGLHSNNDCLFRVPWPSQAPNKSVSVNG